MTCWPKRRGEKEDGKVILPVLFIPPFYSIPSLSQAQTQQVGKWVTRFVIIASCFQGDWVYIFRERGWNEDKKKKKQKKNLTTSQQHTDVLLEAWNFTIRFKVAILYIYLLSYLDILIS